MAELGDENDTKDNTHHVFHENRKIFEITSLVIEIRTKTFS